MGLDQYDADEAEEKWQEWWEDHDIYTFDGDGPVFSIDTPPPTVSGRMHIGHAFSYTQGDFIARYKRMRGFDVFYPFGTDDNGLPTERLVEQEKGVSANDMDRSAFRKVVRDTVQEKVASFTADWKKYGISCDFQDAYSTISDHCVKTSQKSFVDLFKKGLVYRKETPVSWDTEHQTAIAQAEFENVEKRGYLDDIAFHDTHGNELVISTTRPELIPACVALAAHPEDERYQDLHDRDVIVPITEHRVPVIFDESVDKEFGTGLMMICTFGDKEDIEKWYKHDLELRSIMEPDGTLNETAGPYQGLSIKEARTEIVEDLKEEGYLKNAEKITHNVNVYERSGVEVEYLNTPQWFVRVLDYKHDLLEAGDEINWIPDFMEHRYEHWVQGLHWDWCISRQRPYGVPFPVWYEKDSGEIIVPDEDELPVDPTEDTPRGYDADDVVAETDVMDTWATSSVTPQIALDWAEDEDRFDELFPMDLRLQAHDIIRTWAFYTIVKSEYHHKDKPWENIAISGHALDSDGKKMSKSKGNVVDPNEMREEYSADAVRYWAAGAKLGEDMPFQEKDLRTGEKTIRKLWNASKFAMMHVDEYDGTAPDSFETMDAWMLDRFNRLVEQCTEHFDRYEYAKVKLAVDDFFWNTFCDYYLEIVKDRLYNPEERGADARVSAQYTLYHVLQGVVKMFAPIMPHVTEELWHECFREKEGVESVHVSSWPRVDADRIDDTVKDVGDTAIDVIAAVRKYKTDNEMSLGAEVDTIAVTAPVDLSDVVEDIEGTCRAESVTVESGSEFDVTVD
jgi:valyl-tRNA synthetase